MFIQQVDKSVPVRVVEFEKDCRDAVTRVRAAIIDLFDALGADPTTPQRISRKFGLNKTLTWNMAKVVESGDSLAAAPHVPGRASMEKVLEVSLQSGAPAHVAGSVRDAITNFDRMVELHIGDRADLELMLDSMGLRSPDGAELSRRLAFRGMSGVLGVQARSRLMCCLLAPNSAQPASLDMAMISGYSRFRRLRADMRWPLFKERTWSDKDDPIAAWPELSAKALEALDPYHPKPPSHVSPTPLGLPATHCRVASPHAAGRS